jgi:hypothetical protein
MSLEQATIQRLQSENEELRKSVRALENLVAGLEPQVVFFQEEHKRLTRKVRKFNKIRNELSKLKQKLKRGGCLLKSRDNDDMMFWGADNGYVTIWRIPPGLGLHDTDDFDDRFGNKGYLGEEWGSFTQLYVKTVTRRMLNADNWCY